LINTYLTILLILLSLVIVLVNMNPNATPIISNLTIEPYYYVYSPDIYVDNSIFVAFQASGVINFIVISSKDFSNFKNGLYYSPKFQINSNNFYGTINLSKGYYILIFKNPNPFSVKLLVYYSTSTSPSGIGIVDYGIELLRDGKISTYSIKYDAIYAYARIYSILARSSDLVQNYGASLQLNVVLNIDTVKGSQQYWLQNVVIFNTINSTYYYLDNIWNFTNPAFLNNVYGSGNVFSAGSYKYYAYGTFPQKYFLPLDLLLVIKVSYDPSKVTISFGAREGVDGSVYWYDNVSLMVAGIKSAYLLVSGGNFTTYGLPYDAEFVFGGESSGLAAQFYQLDALLYMYYVSNNTIILPKTLFPFSKNTAESAYNVFTSNYNGVYRVLIGSNYSYALFTKSYPLNVSLKYSEVTDLGIPAFLNISLYSGTPPFIITLTIKNASTQSIIESKEFMYGLIGGFYKNFTLPLGSYLVDVEIKDFYNNSKKFSYSLIVNKNPTLTLEANSTVTDVGIPVILIAKVSEGTPPYNFTWTVNGKVMREGGSNYILNTTLPGEYIVEVSVKDKVGYVVKQGLRIYVNPLPNFKVNIVTGSSLTRINSSVNIIISAENGTKPYQAIIYLNGRLVSSSNFSIPPTLSKSLDLDVGKNNLTIILRDYYGFGTRYTFVIISESNYLIFYVIGAIVLTIVIVVLVLRIRKK